MGERKTEDLKVTGSIPVGDKNCENRIVVSTPRCGRGNQSSILCFHMKIIVIYYYYNRIIYNMSNNFLFNWKNKLNVTSTTLSKRDPDDFNVNSQIVTKLKKNRVLFLDHGPILSINNPFWYELVSKFQKHIDNSDENIVMERHAFNGSSTDMINYIVSLITHTDLLETYDIVVSTAITEDISDSLNELAKNIDVITFNTVAKIVDNAIIHLGSDSNIEQDIGTNLAIMTGVNMLETLLNDSSLAASIDSHVLLEQAKSSNNINNSFMNNNYVIKTKSRRPSFRNIKNVIKSHLDTSSDSTIIPNNQLLRFKKAIDDVITHILVLASPDEKENAAFKHRHEGLKLVFDNDKISEIIYSIDELKEKVNNKNNSYSLIALHAGVVEQLKEFQNDMKDEGYNIISTGVTDVLDSTNLLVEDGSFLNSSAGSSPIEQANLLISEVKNQLKSSGQRGLYEAMSVINQKISDNRYNHKVQNETHHSGVTLNSINYSSIQILENFKDEYENNSIKIANNLMNSFVFKGEPNNEWAYKIIIPEDDSDNSKEIRNKINECIKKYKNMHNNADLTDEDILEINKNEGLITEKDLLGLKYEVLDARDFFKVSPKAKENIIKYKGIRNEGKIFTFQDTFSLIGEEKYKTHPLIVNALVKICDISETTSIIQNMPSKKNITRTNNITSRGKIGK